MLVGRVGSGMLAVGPRGAKAGANLLVGGPAFQVSSLWGPGGQGLLLVCWWIGKPLALIS